MDGKTDVFPLPHPSPACVEVSQEEQGVPAEGVVQSPSLLQREQQGIFCSHSTQTSTAPQHIPPSGWGQKIPKSFRAATLPHIIAKRINSVRADTKLWSSCSKGTDYCNMSHGKKKPNNQTKKNSTWKPADNKSSQNIFLRMGNDREKKKKKRKKLSLFFSPVQKLIRNVLLQTLNRKYRQKIFWKM